MPSFDEYVQASRLSKVQKPSQRETERAQYYEQYVRRFDEVRTSAIHVAKLAVAKGMTTDFDLNWSKTIYRKHMLSNKQKVVGAEVTKLCSGWSVHHQEFSWASEPSLDGRPTGGSGTSGAVLKTDGTIVMYKQAGWRYDQNARSVTLQNPPEVQFKADEMGTSLMFRSEFYDGRRFYEGDTQVCEFLQIKLAEFAISKSLV